MVYLGIAIMACNVWAYIRFARRMRRHGDWKSEGRIFNVPILLLVLFLAGYVAVALSGRADLIVSSILLGGSIFVAVMLLLMARIARRIQENERLRAEVTAAEGASRAKTRFLSNMSHDIRTPLNAIIGYAELAKSAPPEQQAEYIEKIGSAGCRMLSLVNEVLEMSRIESGRLELEPCNADLEEILMQAHDLMETQMEEKGIDFSVSCDIMDRWVMCDAHRLSRVLMNMLSNACKFTERGGHVSMSLRQTDARNARANYEFRVKDDGIGMSPGFAAHVFTPFERERTSTVSRTQGTGLGMAISKSIIDLMGGTISVTSAPGEGTEFIITVSFPTACAPAVNASPTGTSECTANARLLLVEDNEINREIAVMLLSQAGYAVETAEDGKKAVEMVSSCAPGHFDCILMDIQMPVMDGYAATRAIRALEDSRLSSIPIIAMTANAFTTDRQQAADAGMQGHISKPIDTQAMLETIRTVLEDSRAYAPVERKEEMP
ncbi:MAG: response regulator [Clostridiales bacterium]|nr:response regulator [Clostridiales bacterium]